MADPAAELMAHCHRMVAIPVKDMAPPGTAAKEGRAETGHGINDWNSLIPQFCATKADHVVTNHNSLDDWRQFSHRSIQYIQRIML